MTNARRLTHNISVAGADVGARVYHKLSKTLTHLPVCYKYILGYFPNHVLVGATHECLSWVRFFRER